MGITTRMTNLRGGDIDTSVDFLVKNQAQGIDPPPITLQPVTDEDGNIMQSDKEADKLVSFAYQVLDQNGNTVQLSNPLLGKIIGNFTPPNISNLTPYKVFEHASDNIPDWLNQSISQRHRSMCQHRIIDPYGFCFACEIQQLPIDLHG